MELDAETSSKQLNNNPTNTSPVRSTIFVITRSLIGMTITDINTCAALVFFTERIRGGSKKFRNALEKQDVGKQKLVKFCSGFSLATTLLTTQSYLLYHTANNTKFSYIFYTQAGFVSSIIFLFYLSSYYSTTTYIQKNTM